MKSQKAAQGCERASSCDSGRTAVDLTREAGIIQPEMRADDTPISIAVVSLGACALTEPGSDFPVGGAELQLDLLAKKLAEQPGFRVALYVADVGQDEREEEAVLIRPLVVMARDLRLTLFKSVAILRRLARERHDLYVTRSASGINGLVFLASRLSGGRHLHMCAHDDECSGKVDATLSRMARRFHRLAMRRADAIACQTEAQREALRQYYNRDAAVCPNLPPPAPPEEAGQPRDGVLWVGRDVEWKRPELFVELATRLPDHTFTMVCQPQPGRDVGRLGANAPDNLKIVPGLPFRETERLFATHQVFVNTSRVEGFPNTFLQAAAAGTPIVSLSVDPGGLIARRKAGFVCDGWSEKAVGGVRKLTESSTLFAEYSANARRLADALRESSREAIGSLVRKVTARKSPCAG